MAFFDTLAVNTLRVGETKETLFEMATTRPLAKVARAMELKKCSLFPVPESKGKVEPAVSVRYTSNAVFAPSEGSRAGHIVREGAPCIAIIAAEFVSRWYSFEEQ